MRITYSYYSHGLIHGMSSVQYQLFLHLCAQVYPEMCNSPSYVVDFKHMAIQLRKQDWKIYYWQKPAQDEQDYMANGHQEGLIIGRYCGNLMAWLLTYT